MPSGSLQPEQLRTCDFSTAAGDRRIIEGKPCLFKVPHRTAAFILTLVGVVVSMSVRMDVRMYD